jgi:hypothetical protein
MDTDVDRLSELMGRYGRGEDSAFPPLCKVMAPRLYRVFLRLAASALRIQKQFGAANARSENRQLRIYKCVAFVQFQTV